MKQLWALSPIDATEEGIITSDNDLKFWNVYSFILVTLERIYIISSNDQLLNALILIDSTVDRISNL